MLTCDGPKVIEFNVRFGDPEAQVVIPAIEGELAPRLAAAAGGLRSADAPVTFAREKHVGVVLASEGYPGERPDRPRHRGLEWRRRCRTCWCSTRAPPAAAGASS